MIPKKICLVIGSNSFSGACLVDYLLNNGFKVIGLFKTPKKKKFLKFSENKNIKNYISIQFDLNSTKKKLLTIVKKYKPNYIVDFASLCLVNESWYNPKLYMQTNVTNKIDFLKDISYENYLKKYIYISTPEVFGSSKKSQAENSTMFNPSTPYAISKLAIELYMKIINKNFKGKYIVARFSNFYGETQEQHRLLPKLFESIKSKKFFFLQGNGLSKRNFIYETDFCEGILKIIQKGKINKNYHFCSNDIYSIVNITKLVCKASNVRFNNLVKKTKDSIGKDQIYKLNCLKTKKELNWKPNVSLIQGINKLKNYYLMKK